MGGAIALTLGIIVLASVIYLPLGNTSTTTGTTRVDTTTSKSESGTYSISTTTTNSSLGLELGLTINASSFVTGDSINISAQILNTLQTVNNVTSSNDWAYSSGSLNPFTPCGVSGPVGVAIFQGNYDSTDFTSAKALALYDTTVFWSCTATTVIGTTNVNQKNYYSFQPQSDQATLVYPSYTPANSNTTASLSFETKGYWTTGPDGGVYQAPNAPFHNFPQGNYTVLAADEWGQIVISHFTVLSSTSSQQSPLKMESRQNSVWNFTVNIDQNFVYPGSSINLVANLTNISGQNLTTNYFVVPIINPLVTAYSPNGTQVWGWYPPQESWTNYTITAGESFAQKVTIPTSSLAYGQQFFIHVVPLFNISSSANLGVVLEFTVGYPSINVSTSMSTAHCVTTNNSIGCTKTTSSNTITMPAVCPAVQSFNTFEVTAGNSSPAVICLQLYYYSQNAITLNLSNTLTIHAIYYIQNGSMGIPVSFSGSANFTVTPSQSQIVLGGPNNENEGSIVAFSILANAGASGTYEVGIFRSYGTSAYELASQPNSCGYYGELIAGSGQPNYAQPFFNGCLTYTVTTITSGNTTEATSTSSTSHSVSGIQYQLLNSYLYFGIIGVTNSTQ